MRMTTVPGLLIVAALSYFVAPPSPWQDPPGGRRPGPPGRGEQDPGRPPRPDHDEGDPPPPPFGPPPNPMFLAIDTNDDGELSANEIANASKSLLKLDRDKDGILTEEEVRPPRPGGRRGPGGPPPPVGRGVDPKAMVESVMKHDKDGDGKVSAKELPANMARMLEDGDENKDGSLEKSEVEALSRRQPPRRQGAPVGGPPGSPPGGPPGGDGPPRPGDEDHGRPVEAVAKELGVTPEKFREVFKKVRPAGPGRQPTEAQRQRNRKVLSEGLGISPERLDEVMDKYRPGGKVNDGPSR